MSVRIRRRIKKVISAVTILATVIGMYAGIDLGTIETEAAVAGDVARTVYVGTKEELRTAVNTAVDGDVIKLKNNISMAPATSRSGCVCGGNGSNSCYHVVVPRNVFLTIDLNGKTLTSGTTSSGDTYGVASGAALLFQNGTLDNMDTNNTNSGTIILNKVRVNGSIWLGNTKMYVVNNSYIGGVALESGALNPNTNLNVPGPGVKTSPYNYVNAAPALVGSGVYWNCYQDMDLIFNDVNTDTTVSKNKILMLDNFTMQTGAILSRGYTAAQNANGLVMEFNSYTLDLNGNTFEIDPRANEIVNLRNGTIKGDVKMQGQEGAHASSQIRIANMCVDGKLTTNGHTVRIESGSFKGDVTQSGEGVVTICGGDFRGKLTGTEYGYFIMGGTFAYKPLDSWIPHGYEIKPLAKGGYEVIHGDHYGWYDWERSDALPAVNAIPNDPVKSGQKSFCLTKDVTLSSTWEVSSGVVNICLFDHKLLTNNGNDSMIKVKSGATLNLYDCKEIWDHGYIGGFSGSGDKAAIEVEAGGTLNVYSGRISRNNSGNGSAILNHGSCTISGGTIGGSTETEGNSTSTGGAVANCTCSAHTNATLTINGGKFLNNRGAYGGAIYSKKNVVINSGTFKGNKATDNEYGGGAVCAPAGTLRITNGNFLSNETTSLKGGAVYIGAGTTATISGGKYTSNKKDKNSGGDIFGPARISGTLVVEEWGLAEGQTITITGALGEDSSIGINVNASNNGVFTSSYKTGTGVETGDVRYFYLSPVAYPMNKNALDTEVAIIYNASNELEIVNHSHAWTLSNDSNQAADQAQILYAYCNDSVENQTCGHYHTAEDSLDANNCSSYLSLMAPDMVYTGDAYSKAIITDKISDITSSTLSVKYFMLTQDDIWVMTNATYGGARSEYGAPKEPGTYKVEVTLNQPTTDGPEGSDPQGAGLMTIDELEGAAPDNVLAMVFRITTSNIVQKDGDNYKLDTYLDEYQKTHPGTKKISGGEDENMANLHITLTSKWDKVTIYKLADFVWNPEIQDFSEATWVPKVDEWIQSHPLYGNLTGNQEDNIYSTPNMLGESYDLVWNEFYKAMLTSTSTNPYNVTYTTDNPDGLVPLYSSQTFTREVTHEGALPTYVTDIPNLTLGQYGIVATYGTKVLKPVVINIIPDKASPYGSYYMTTDYYTNLKDSLAEVIKTIDDKRSEPVGLDDVVHFRVVGQIPPFDNALPEEAQLESGDTISYALTSVYLEDHMDDAFELIPDSIVVKYNCDTAEDEKHRKEKDQDFDAERVYYTVITGASGIATPDSGAATTDSIIRVDFNVDNLKAMVIANQDITTLDYVILEYDAKVTSKIKYNNESNYNNALLFYTINNETKWVIDTVRAYTYGVEVVKMDGNSYERGTPKYLQGAQFRLYRQVSDTAFLGGSDDVIQYEVALDPENPNDTTTMRFEAMSVPVGYEDLGYDDANGNFTTGANGKVTVGGLSPGRYVISEITAPFDPESGRYYNKLTEDMMFEVVALSDNEVLRRAGSYLACKDSEDATRYIENGVISINVLNYIGLSLPATGGMGTLLFTIIGISLMGFTIYAIIRRRRYEEYCEE